MQKWCRRWWWRARVPLSGMAFGRGNQAPQLHLCIGCQVLWQCSIGRGVLGSISQRQAFRQPND
eukprot:4547841-Alexandrium_andersonii.AAC.2